MKALLVMSLGVLFLSLNLQASELGQKDTECIATQSSLSRSASKELKKKSAESSVRKHKVQTLKQ